MNSVLKNVCKIKVPLKIVEHPHKTCIPCKTEIQAVVYPPKSSLNLNSSRSYHIASNEEYVKNDLINLQTSPKYRIYRRSFAQKSRHTGYERTAPCDENDKKKDEVTEEQCMSPKSDRKVKKYSERSLKFTINLNEMIHSFNKKNNLVKAQGINKINTFSLKPGRCRCCTSRKKNQLDRFEQKRYISFSSKEGVHLPTYQVNKTRKLLSYKQQTGGGVSYKIKETSRGKNRGEKLLKIPLFYILKDKFHSNSQVVQGLSKRLRYHIGTNEALFGNTTNSSPALNVDTKLSKTENSEALSDIKKKHKKKLCMLASDTTKKTSDYKLNFNNIKKNYILQMLTEILIPLIEKESVQYEEMRRVFVHLQKELEQYLKEIKDSGIRSEEDIFKIIATINQAKKHQKVLETIPLCRKNITQRDMKETSETIDDAHISKDKYCLDENCSDGASNSKTFNENDQLDEFPIAILVKDRKQQMEPQKIPYPYLGIGNSSKKALTVRSSESESKYIRTRTYASDSKSTRGVSRDNLGMSFNSFVDQDSDAGCFQYFQNKSIPPQLTHRPKEQFTIPLESECKRAVPLTKPYDPELSKKSRESNDYTANQLKSTTSTTHENSSVKPPSHSTFTSAPKKEMEPKIIVQAALSKAGMENLRKIQKLEELKQAEARLPFEDGVSERNISNEPNIFKKESFSCTNELPLQFPIKPTEKLRNVEPKPFSNKWTPKKIIKSNSTPILKNDSTVHEKSGDQMVSEKNKTINFLDNCRGIFETIFRKFKGPPKRNLGSYIPRKSLSTSTVNTVDKDQESDYPIAKMNKPAITLKLKQKYPWNRLRINEKMLIRNYKNDSRRVYSTNTRKYPFCKKDFSTAQDTNTSLTTGNSSKNKYPWNFTEIEAEENTNCCYLTKTSYCNINKISSAEPEVPKLCDNTASDVANKSDQEKLDKNKQKDCKNMKSQILDEENHKKLESKNKLCKEKQALPSATEKKPSTEEQVKESSTKVCEKNLDILKKQCEKQIKVVENVCQTKSQQLKTNLEKKSESPKKVCDEPPESAKTEKSKCTTEKKSQDSDKIHRSKLQECKSKTRDKENKKRKSCSGQSENTSSAKTSDRNHKKAKNKRKLCQSVGKDQKIKRATKKKTCAALVSCGKKQPPKKIDCSSEKPKQDDCGTKSIVNQKSVCQGDQVKEPKESISIPSASVCQDKRDNKPIEPICKLCPTSRQDNQDVRPKQPICKPGSETGATEKQNETVTLRKGNQCENKEKLTSSSPNLLCSKSAEKNNNNCNTSEKMVAQKSENTISNSYVAAQNEPSKCKTSVETCLDAKEILCDKKSSFLTSDPIKKHTDLVTKATKNPTVCDKKEKKSFTNLVLPSAVISETKTINTNFHPENKAKSLVKKGYSKPETCDKKDTECKQPETQKPEINCENGQQSKLEKKETKVCRDRKENQSQQINDREKNESKSKICDKKSNQPKKSEVRKDSNGCGQKLKSECVKKDRESKLSSSPLSPENKFLNKSDFSDKKMVETQEQQIKSKESKPKAASKSENCDQKKNQLKKEESLKDSMECELKQNSGCEKKESKLSAQSSDKLLNKAACSDKKNIKSQIPQMKAKELVQKAISKPETCDIKEKQSDKKIKTEQSSIYGQKQEKSKCTLSAHTEKKCEKQEVSKQSSTCEQKQVNKCENKPSNSELKPLKCEEMKKNTEKSVKNKLDNSSCQKQTKECKTSTKKKDQSCEPEKKHRVCERKEKPEHKENTCDNESQRKKQDKCPKPERKEICEKLVEEFLRKNKKGTGGSGSPSAAAKPKTPPENPNKSVQDNKKCSADAVEKSIDRFQQTTVESPFDIFYFNDKLKDIINLPTDTQEQNNTDKGMKFFEETTETDKSIPSNELDERKKEILPDKVKNNNPLDIPNVPMLSKIIASKSVDSSTVANANNLDDTNRRDISEFSKNKQTKNANDFIRHSDIWTSNTNLESSKDKPLSHALKNKSQTYIFDVLKIRQVKSSPNIKEVDMQPKDECKTNISGISNTNQINVAYSRKLNRHQDTCISKNDSNEASKIKQNETLAFEVNDLSNIRSTKNTARITNVSKTANLQNIKTPEINLTTKLSNVTLSQKTDKHLNVPENQKSQMHDELSAICGNEIKTSSTNLSNIPKNNLSATSTVNNSKRALIKNTIRSDTEESANILETNRSSLSNINDNETCENKVSTNVDEINAYNNYRGQSPISSDLSKPRAVNLEDDGEIFMCKIEKVTKGSYEQRSRTLKCKLVKDQSGREVFLCKEINDEDSQAKAVPKKKVEVLPTTKSKSSSEIPSRGLSSKPNVTYNLPSSIYLEIQPIRITREILRRDNKQMEKLLERYKSIENEETRQRIYRIYSVTRKLLNHYYLIDKENDSKIYFNYKDIVLKQYMRQRNDNRDTLEHST